jgi:uncharacterized membrane protein YadS
MPQQQLQLTKSIPASLIILAFAFLIGMILALYGFSQDRELPLYAGVGLSILGAFFGVLRIAVWGDDP